jgi:hypothetical protein
MLQKQKKQGLSGALNAANKAPVLQTTGTNLNPKPKAVNKAPVLQSTGTNSQPKPNTPKPRPQTTEILTS